jgi:hypothetical protein
MHELCTQTGTANAAAFAMPRDGPALTPVLPSPRPSQLPPKPSLAQPRPAGATGAPRTRLFCCAGLV